MKYNPNDTRTWWVEDNPSTKIIFNGPQSMSNTELLTSVLTMGRFTPANEIAKALLKEVEGNLKTLANLSYIELIKIPGIGQKRASLLLSVFELAKRRESIPDINVKIKSSQSIADIFIPRMKDIQYEEFWIVLLNRANNIIKSVQISKGGISGTVIDIRIILKHCIDNLASSFICIHNHPSGNKQPSDADIKITEKLKDSSNIMEIKLLDHLIIAKHSYLSLADEGLI